MKIAVTGAQGNLGSELVRRGCIPIDCDILQPNDFGGILNTIDPDVLIHCAALTNVDYCETHFKEAFETNVRGTSNVMCSMQPHMTMIYMSTDHVFSGDNWFNQGYGERHKPNPVNYYGYTKWGGELVTETGDCRCVIIRTSRTFNYSYLKPTIEGLMNGHELVFTNLIKRSFMYLPYLADGVIWVANNLDKLGDERILHISGESVFSYSAFWEIVRQYFDLPGKIIPRNEKIETTPRPFRAGLDCRTARKLGVPMGSMNSALEIVRDEWRKDFGI